jgi:hypothetical protein
MGVHGRKRAPRLWALGKALSVRRMRKCWLLLILFLTLAGGAAWVFRGAIHGWWHARMGSVGLSTQPSLKPDPQTYRVLSAELERWRLALAKRHASARNEVEREAVINDARVILEHALPAMMRCWLGTPWDFNGTADGPGKGRIACGYFVATVLRDSGFQVNRYKLAQQPSENILRSFLPKEACFLTVGMDYQVFAANLEMAQPGIYLVGLDTHVAFLVVTSDGFRFIHSSGSRPWCVVDEKRVDAVVLEKSNWRMLGNLTADTDVLKRWLKSEKIAVRETW